MSQFSQILACRIRKALYSLYLATENAPALLTLNCPPFVISGGIIAREEAYAISEEGQRQAVEPYEANPESYDALFQGAYMKVTSSGDV